MPKPKTYGEDDIMARLASDLPDWRYTEGAIQRTFKTAGWKGTLMVVTAIGHLAEAAWHHPDLAVSYDAVTVKLSTHSPKGITDLDFLLAAKIGEVILWRPEPPFSGTPGDPAHAYLIYD